MKLRRIVLVGVLVLFLVLIAFSSTASASTQKPSPTIVIQPGEGVTFHSMSNGQEPPPHVIILDKDGSFVRVVPNQGHHTY